MSSWGVQPRFQGQLYRYRFPQVWVGCSQAYTRRNSSMRKYTPRFDLLLGMFFGIIYIYYIYMFVPWTYFCWLTRHHQLWLEHQIVHFYSAAECFGVLSHSRRLRAVPEEPKSSSSGLEKQRGIPPLHFVHTTAQPMPRLGSVSLLLTRTWGILEELALRVGGS